MVLVGAVLGAAVLTSDTTSDIFIESSKDAVRAGEPFSIDILVDAHAPVNAIDIKVALPSEYVEVVGINTGESVITLWTEEPYIENGTAYFRGGTFRKGFVGQHKIASINLVANESGLAEFTVSEVLLLAGDGSGSEISLSDSSTSKDIYIALADGTFPEGARTLEGEVSLMIVTDIDGDGDVSLRDISRFMAAWRDQNTVYDFSGDGKMTFRDFAIILSDSFFK